jgi:glycosyltransferase involved in cell wall biosynthesis
MILAAVSVPGKGLTDACLADAVALMQVRGLKLAGTVQSNPQRVDRPRCDMDVHVLPDGPVLRISEDRGPAARGCRLDAGVLEAAVAATLRRLDGAELLVVNKFGNQEAEGRGFVPVIAEAMARGLPVLVGVNPLNRDVFHAFADGLAQDLDPAPEAIAAWGMALRRACAA